MARPLSQEVLQNELIALPSKDASYPLTKHCYPHTAKINASVACALMATYGYSSYVSHYSEGLKGKSLLLSLFSNLGHI